MRNASWDRLRAEILSLYEPPLRAKATWWQMRQILTEFGSSALGQAGQRPVAPQHRRLDPPASRPQSGPHRQPAALPVGSSNLRRADGTPAA